MRGQKKSVPGYISNFPFSPDKKKPARITRDKSAQHLYGFEGTWNEVFTFASTDKITLSLYYLPPGGYVDPPGCHLHGDEWYHVIEGEAVLTNPETGKTMHLAAGDTAYIPQASRHQIFNFKEEELAVLSVLAPVAWKDDGMGTNIPVVKEPIFFNPGVDIKKGKFNE